MPSHSPDQLYRQRSLEGTSPMERLIAVYTFAIDAAVQRDRDGVFRAIALLRSTLDFAADPMIALGLDKLYQQCEHHLSADDFGPTLAILEALRATWKRMPSVDPNTSAAWEGSYKRT